MCARRVNLHRQCVKLGEINQGELDPITDALLDHAVVAMRSAADRGDADTIAK